MTNTNSKPMTIVNHTLPTNIEGGVVCLACLHKGSDDYYYIPMHIDVFCAQCKEEVPERIRNCLALFERNAKEFCENRHCNDPSCYTCSIGRASEEELEYYEDFAYLYPYHNTPAEAFEACRKAFQFVAMAVEYYNIDEKLLKLFQEAIGNAEENNYYPELDFASQTVCWVGMTLAGGNLDILKDHIMQWRVRSWGHDLLNSLVGHSKSPRSLDTFLNN